MVVIVVIFAVAAFSWALGVGFFLGYYAAVPGIRFNVPRAHPFEC